MLKQKLETSVFAFGSLDRLHVIILLSCYKTVVIYLVHIAVTLQYFSNMFQGHLHHRTYVYHSLWVSETDREFSDRDMYNCKNK